VPLTRTGSRRWRDTVLVLAVAACAVAVFTRPPIPQAREYHEFADARTLFGVPNAFDVLSNIPFAIIGIAGLITVFRFGDDIFSTPWERWPYATLFVGVALTAAGSSYYHLAPDNDRLVWDRLPMTIGFMGLLTAMIAERVSLAAAKALLWPLLVLGCASVLYWHWTELRGAGDLRLYALVQFGSLILVALLVALYPPRYQGSGYLIAGLVLYAAAKGFESADRVIVNATHVVSGHTLKHLSAAAGVACIVAMLRARASSVRPTRLPATGP
jgi:hypothetical protein